MGASLQNWLDGGFDSPAVRHEGTAERVAAATAVSARYVKVNLASLCGDGWLQAQDTEERAQGGRPRLERGSGRFDSCLLDQRRGQKPVSPRHGDRARSGRRVWETRSGRCNACIPDHPALGNLPRLPPPGIQSAAYGPQVDYWFVPPVCKTGASRHRQVRFLRGPPVAECYPLLCQD